MPPKKKVADAQSLEGKQQHAEHLERQCQAVELLLMLTGEEIRQAEQEIEVLRRRGVETQQRCDNMEQTIDTQMRVMMNMSMTNEENMRIKLRNLEQQVAEAEAANAALRARTAEMRSVRGEELQQLRDSVKALRCRLGEKALQYGVELREILMMTQPILQTSE